MSPRTYVVWEVEHPDGGSSEIPALTGREAKAKYRELTGSEPEVELGAALLTPEMRAERVKKRRYVRQVGEKRARKRNR